MSGHRNRLGFFTTFFIGTLISPPFFLTQPNISGKPVSGEDVCIRINFKWCIIVKLWIIYTSSKLVRRDTGAENLRAVQSLRLLKYLFAKSGISLSHYCIHIATLYHSLSSSAFIASQHFLRAAGDTSGMRYAVGSGNSWC